MKDKRNTPQRTRRTLGQAVAGQVISWTLVETMLQEAFPALQDGNYKLAAIAALGVALTALSSTVQNWLDNRKPERRNGPLED